MSVATDISTLVSTAATLRTDANTAKAAAANAAQHRAAESAGLLASAIEAILQSELGVRAAGQN